MGNEKLGLVGLAVVLIIVAILIGQSQAEPFVKTAFVFGCLIGAILCVVALVKSD